MSSDPKDYTEVKPLLIFGVPNIVSVERISDYETLQEVYMNEKRSLYRIHFVNGKTISVVSHSSSYGNVNEWEALDITNGMGEDPVGYLSEGELLCLLTKFATEVA